MERIEDLVVELSKDPFNPELNFAVANRYEELNQTASAVSFYLRTAEYSEKENDPLVYASLIKMAHCFHDQNDRNHTVTNCLLQAIAYWPERPEAYFFLSQFHEQAGNWQECYTYAEIGLHLADFEPLPIDTGYYGKYCLEFERAVSSFWIGRQDDSIIQFIKLKQYDLHPTYAKAVEENLKKLNVTF